MRATDFQVGQIFRNAKHGACTVVANNGVKLSVLPEGSVRPVELDAEIQARILTRMGISERIRTESVRPGGSGGWSTGRHSIEDWRRADWRWWLTVGFIAGRFQSLTFLTPPEKLEKLLDELRLITAVPEDLSGIYVTDSNKWAPSSGVVFKASQDEVDWLRVFFAGFCEVTAQYTNTDGSGGWGININDVTCELLRLGFCIGEGVDIDSVRLNIPERFRDAFERGLAGQLGSSR
jgi:hypothetical protein